MLVVEALDFGVVEFGVAFLLLLRDVFDDLRLGVDVLLAQESQMTIMFR